jgi:Ca-activated chloride channel homolog
MIDDDLKRLKDLPVPSARAEARAAALAAAMAAFDASDATIEAATKKNDDAPQGCAEPIRLTHASQQTRRRSLMRVSSHYKIAASISVLLIAAPLTYHMLSQHQETNRPVASAKTDSALSAPQTPSTRAVAQAEQAPRLYVERINVVGNARTRDYVIRRELRLAEGDFYDKRLADQAGQRLAQLGIFKTVKLSQETGTKPDRVVLTYTLEEPTIDELPLAGTSYTSEYQFADARENEQARPSNPAVVQSEPAKVTAETPAPGKTPKIYVERINIVGIVRTRDPVIRRELRFAEGDIYDGLLADQARQRLEQLGFFKTVKLSQETGTKPDRIVLTFTLEEVPTGEMSIAGAYTPECCADIEKRVAELEATTARKGNRVVSLQIYGQVNKALLIWDDGVDSDAYVSDNQLASSRVGLKGKAAISSGATTGFNAEFELSDASSSNDAPSSKQGDSDGASGKSIRQNNFWIEESDKLGRVTVSQATTADASSGSGTHSNWANNLDNPASDSSESLQSGPPSAAQTLLGAQESASGGTVAAPQQMAAAEQQPPLPPDNTQQFRFGAAPSFGTAARALNSEPPSPVVEEKEARDQFEATAPNPVKQVAAEPVSTFSTDVDTASYAFVRRALNTSKLPPKDSVRVEEMINYFPYTYPLPEKADAPFQPTVTVTPAPWNTAHKLMHIGIKGYDIKAEARPHANLVFLVDVSGSMDEPDKLPLVKNAFRLLVDELKPDDTVGIVIYASDTGVVLEPTKVANKTKILAAIDRLGAGGSTSGAKGIQTAYHLAETNFDKAAVNRIILATDGDFNVGITNQDELKGFIERKRETGIFLSILGVGQGNYNDSLMQKLAQNGNGTAAYVDTLNEARKVLVDEASSTLFTIAKDVKIQVEFNPTQVSEYRLIGYETRALKREDFNNDKVDAGDIGSGHTVTAIYEITPVGAPKSVDDLRYQKPEEKPAVAPANGSNEYAFLKLRYKLPKEDTSKLITLPITTEMEKPSIDAASEEVRFSVAVAAFGQILRGQPFVQNYSFDDVMTLARGARGTDDFGYRAEFVNLVRIAKSIRP